MRVKTILCSLQIITMKVEDDIMQESVKKLPLK